jgi:outer membrane immunogenic protein
VPLHRAVRAACVVILLSSSARGADLGGYVPPPQSSPADALPPLMWTGLYVGLNGGYAGSRDVTHEVSATPYDGLNLEHFRSRTNGFTGGGQIGYNYQLGHLVVGVEADFNYLDFSRSVTSPSAAVTESVSGSFVGTVRPRVGLAFGPALFYATGGLAYGSVDTTITGNTANTLNASNTDMRIGWSAGGGVEYALGRHWSLRAEYLHTDLGRADASGMALDTNTYTWRNHLSDDAVRLGINFRF